MVVLLAAISATSAANATLTTISTIVASGTLWTNMTTPPTPSEVEASAAGTARHAFLNHLASSYNTEGFESQAYTGPSGTAGTPSRSLTFPSTMFGGAAIVAMGTPLPASDGIEDAACASDPINGTICTGRYNTTTGGSRWLQSAVSFSLTFDQAFSAFGFYGTDIGDFKGSLDVSLSNAVTGAKASASVQGDNSGNGSLLFLGLVDSVNTFNTITFTITQPCDPTATGCTAATDILGFDDMVVGNAKTDGGGNTVPEPTTLALTGLALVGLAASRRKRRG